MLISLSAIKISDYKKWGAKFNKDLYKNIFQRYTKKKNAYRIYLPVGEHYVENRIEPLPEIVSALSALGYVIEDYATGLAIKADGTKKNPVRIGKLLNKSPDLLAKYAKHKLSLGIKNTSDLVVVISRHPYDIMGMSTDRAWVSCTRMGLPSINYKHLDEEVPGRKDQGGNHTYVIDDAEHGNLIAYLVKKGDTNITRPLARVRILRYVNKNTNDFILRMHDAVYGSDSPAFRKTVRTWLSEVNEVDSTGVYCAFDSIENKEFDDDEGEGGKIFLIRSEDELYEQIKENLRNRQHNNENAATLVAIENAITNPRNTKFLTLTFLAKLIDFYRQQESADVKGAVRSVALEHSLQRALLNENEALLLVNKIFRDLSADQESVWRFTRKILNNPISTTKVLHRILDRSLGVISEDYLEGLFKAIVKHPKTDSEACRKILDLVPSIRANFALAKEIFLSRLLSGPEYKSLLSKFSTADQRGLRNTVGFPQDILDEDPPITNKPIILRSAPAKPKQQGPVKLVRTEVEIKPQIKKDDRVIIKLGDDSFSLATVTLVRAGKAYVLFDDGDKGTCDNPAEDIVGIAGKRTRKTPFSKADISKYLIKE
jgi:hypothetical protein